MKKSISCLLLVLLCVSASFGRTLDTRGVVYDVGLNYGGSTLSVANFNSEQVRYDMSVIADILNCNAVRIEGENIDRLTLASREAGRRGLKVFFNPWLHGADSVVSVDYMREAARAAEKLRHEGLDLVFVAGCEYTLFCKGAFPGEKFNDRMNWLMGLRDNPDALSLLAERCRALNRILASVVAAVRSEFGGPVTYSSGTWETVDWSLFDIVGIDYYHNGEPDAEYVAGVERYKQYGKPVVVMETGCCTYTGASSRGSFGFTVLQGVDAEGNAMYEGGKIPERNEKEQADYISSTIELLQQASADGVFIFVFAYPIYPHSATGLDLDMTSYALVKSYPAGDARSQSVPAWRPKLAFYRLGEIYSLLKEKY